MWRLQRKCQASFFFITFFQIFPKGKQKIGEKTKVGRKLCLINAGKQFSRNKKGVVNVLRECMTFQQFLETCPRPAFVFIQYATFSRKLYNIKEVYFTKTLYKHKTAPRWTLTHSKGGQYNIEKPKQIKHFLNGGMTMELLLQHVYLSLYFSFNKERFELYV